MTPEEMRSRIEEAYPESYVDVVDMTGGGTNFQVLVVSDLFDGKTRVQQHQEVMAIFDAELKSGEVHAMTIKTKKPE